jgi:hypothetical protein
MLSPSYSRAFSAALSNRQISCDLFIASLVSPNLRWIVIITAGFFYEKLMQYLLDSFHMITQANHPSYLVWPSDWRMLMQIVVINKPSVGQILDIRQMRGVCVVVTKMKQE